LPAERAPDRRDRVEDVAQLRHVGNLEARDGGSRRAAARQSAVPSPSANDRPEPHRIGNREDVAEEDRRVERKALERLQRHLGRELGLVASP
jgi:hypothetical protein